jgi:anhydro-N-acetylmuramic acid kinase
MTGVAEVRARPVRHVAGLMTGTSMDGLDVGLCEIRPGERLRVDLVHFETVPFPDELRRRIAVERETEIAGIARLHIELGHFFAGALADVLERHPWRLDLVGCHGQTVYHEHGVTTLQLGDPSPLALRFRCPVVSDFRMGDIAAGGSGAPLVPYVDHRLLAARGEALLAVNIGGIANLTALPAGGGEIDDILGMDCGPGNMVLDRLVERYTGETWHADYDGQLARQGEVAADLLDELCDHSFFAEPPPKSTGREQFGEAFVEFLLARRRPNSDQGWCDLLATATELTTFGIADCYQRFVAPVFPVAGVMVSGGGARNPEIMRRLQARFGAVPVRGSDAYGLPVDAKEAIAFAVLASERVDRRPANVPSVTGAMRRVLLGKITEA